MVEAGNSKTKTAVAKTNGAQQQSMHLTTTVRNDVIVTNGNRATGQSAAAATEVINVPQEIAVCPGEGPRYGDFKCNHDRTHRVCAQLLDSTTS